MYTPKVIRRYRFFLKLCTLISSISIQSTKDEEDKGTTKGDSSNPLKIQRIPSSSWRTVQFKVHLFIAVVHNIFLLLCLMLRDTSNFGVTYHVLAIYFTIGYMMCNGCRLCVFWKEEELVKLVNSQVLFEEGLKKKLVKGSKGPPGGDDGEGFEVTLLTMGLLTGVFVPLLVFLILMAHPCLPPFLGSVFFQYSNEVRHCYIEGSSGWTLYVALGLVNFWMHLDMVLPFVFSMFGLFFMSISLLQDYLRVLKREFSLSSSSSSSAEPLRIYRCLQILEKQTNTCFKDLYFPLFLGGMTALLIFCLYACIRLPGKIPMPGFSYFPMVALDGILSLLIMNTKAANVRGSSIQQIRKWKNFQGNNNNRRSSNNKENMKWIMRTVNSFTPLKIRMGSSNFIDEETPLVIVNFTVNQVVSLLLLEER